MSGLRPLERMVRLVEKAEGLKLSPFQWIFIFFSIVMIRNMLEQFGPEAIVFDFPAYFLHFPFAYIAPVLALSILLSLLAQERVERVTRLMLLVWFLTLLPPLIDLVLGRGAPGRIAYLYVDRGNILDIFMNFFNPFRTLEGTTPGIRAEAFIGCLLASTYVFLKTRSRARAVFSLFAVYVSFMFFFTLPYTLITALSSIWPKFGSVALLYFEAGLFLKTHIDRVAYSIALLDLWLIVMFLLWWLRLYSRMLFSSLLSKFRGFGVVNYCLATLFGMAIALATLEPPARLGSLHFYDLLMGVSLLASIACAYWTARALKGWPSPSRGERLPASVMFTLSLLFSGLVGYSSLVFTLTFLAFLVLYYSRPLRLSIYFPISTLLLAFATLSCALSGYSAAAGVLVPKFFPKDALMAILVSCTLGFVVKDYIAFGRRGRIPAAVIMFAGFMSVGLILRSGFLVLAGSILGLSVAVFLLVRVQVRGVSYISYAALAMLVGVMTVRGELPLLLQGRLNKEQILHIERGKDFQIGKMHEQAAIEFEKAVSAGWEDSETFFALGFAYQHIGELGQSAYWYKRAISKDATLIEAYNNLGSVLRTLGQLDSSLVVLKKGLEKDPGSARMMRNMFLTLFDTGKYNELIPMLKRYMVENADDYVSREILADAYMQVGLLEAAETEYRKVLGTKRGHVPAIVGLGYIAANRGRIEEAEKHLLVALELDPTNVDAMHRLGYIYLERGDPARATSLFMEVVKLEPLVANHYDSLGDAYMKGERYEEARRAYQMALALDSTSTHAKEMLRDLGDVH